jgi:hypothetical protein
MAQWSTNDGPVLAAVWRILNRQEHASENETLIELGRPIEDRLAVMRSMKRLNDNGFLVCKVSTGDATIQDVMATSVTEKGLQALGQWPSPNQELIAALIAALNDAADKVAPKEATKLRKAATMLGGISRDVLVDVSVRVAAAVGTHFGLPI